MAIKYFEEEGVRAKLKEKRRLSSYLHDLITEYRPVRKIDLQYIFCSDESLLARNQTFLKHDTLTDIITFDLSESDHTLQSEIYISVDRVRENAEKFKVEYNTELHRVIFHGVLHLCGFKDKTAKDQKLMRAAEDKCLSDYFKTN